MRRSAAEACGIPLPLSVGMGIASSCVAAVSALIFSRAARGVTRCGAIPSAGAAYDTALRSECCKVQVFGDEMVQHSAAGAFGIRAPLSVAMGIAVTLPAAVSVLISGCAARGVTRCG